MTIQIMKYLWFIFLLFGVITSVAAQEAPAVNYTQQDSVTSNFNEKFKTDKEKTDFKYLRNYLSEREGLLAALRSTSLNLHQDGAYFPVTIASGKTIQQKLLALIKGKSVDDSVVVNLAEVTDNFSLQWYPFEEFKSPEGAPAADGNTTFRLRVGLIQQKADRVASYLAEAAAATKRMRRLDRSIEAVEQDVNACRRQIDVALAPEYKQQDFRKDITLYFSLLIALVLVSFFFIVYKNAGNNLSKELLSGNGLQFITLFVLIIAVILFGILNILQSSELAAILAGISGYILGRGTQKNDGTTGGTTG